MSPTLSPPTARAIPPLPAFCGQATASAVEGGLVIEAAMGATPVRSDGLNASPTFQPPLPRQRPEKWLLPRLGRRCNPTWVDVVWLNGMPLWRTDSRRVFSDSRHPRWATPWSIWFCGQKSSARRLSEFLSDSCLSWRFSLDSEIASRFVEYLKRLGRGDPTSPKPDLLTIT